MFLLKIPVGKLEVIIPNLWIAVSIWGIQENKMGSTSEPHCQPLTGEFSPGALALSKAPFKARNAARKIWN